MNIFSPKYRVLEIVMGDGASKFYPQKCRWLLLWKNMKESPYGNDAEPAAFRTLDDANKFLFSMCKREQSEKIVEKRKHPFNEVFQKLKS